MPYYTTITSSEFYETIRQDAAEGGETQWSINKDVEIGDTVLLYVCAPVSAVVATAMVSDFPFLNEDLNSEFLGLYFADMCDLKMLKTPIKRTDLLARFPEWRYWTQPRNSIKVKTEFVPELIKMLQEYGA